MRRSPSRSLPVLIAGGLFAFAGLAPATGQTLTGRVVGPDGRPVPDLPISLHHVTDTGGAQVASATSDSAGAFRFENVAAPTEGLLFAIARYEGEMYVGPPIRGAIPDSGYVLTVGTPENAVSAFGIGQAGAPAGAAGAGGVPGREGPDPVLFWTAVVAVLALGALALLYRQRTAGPEIPPWRVPLMELAAVEERLAALPPDSPDERADFLRLREALRVRAKQALATDSDAAD